MKLVRKDDHTVGIQGTLERISGVALVQSAQRLEDGSLDIEYTGETEVFWDEQKTVCNAQGKRLFVDENGDTVAESGVELIDENEEDA